MKKLILFAAVAVTILVNNTCTCHSRAHLVIDFPFMDPDLPVDKRVDDLVSRMTLEEKIGQMMNAAPAIDYLNPDLPPGPAVVMI